MRLKSYVALGVATTLLLIISVGRYIATHQPVTIFMAFDARAQALKIEIRNNSDESIGFYDTISLPQDGPEYLENVPKSLCVKIFSKTGQLLSKGGFPYGCVSVRQQESIITSPSAKRMSVLLPRQIITSHVTLKELIGADSDLITLQDFCVQFRINIYFDPYLQYPATKESDIACLNSAEGMK